MKVDMRMLYQIMLQTRMVLIRSSSIFILL